MVREAVSGVFVMHMPTKPTPSLDTALSAGVQSLSSLILILTLSLAPIIPLTPVLYLTITPIGHMRGERFGVRTHTGPMQHEIAGLPPYPYTPVPLCSHAHTTQALRPHATCVPKLKA